MSDPTDKPLLISDLNKDIAIVALGAVAAKELMLKKEVAFFVDKNGQIQLVPIAELLLDALPETMAIQNLLEQDVEDSVVAEYLKGRDARMKIRFGGVKGA